MKFKEYLQNLPDDIYGQKSLNSELLSSIKDSLCKFEEFNSKNISIVDKHTIGSKKIITIADINILSNDISIYTIFLNQNNMYISCTEDSINSYYNIYLPEFDQIDDDGNIISNKHKNSD